MAYVTLAELKRYLGSDTANDETLLSWLISAAQAIIDSDVGTGRVWEVGADSTHYFDPTVDAEGAVLHLDADLAQTPTTVTNGDGVVITAASYVLETAGGRRNATPYRRIRLKESSTLVWAYATTPENSISVLGRWGASVTAPTRITTIATEIAAYLYRSRAGAADSTSDRPLLTGDGVTLLARRLPADLMARMRAERSVT